MLKAFKWTAIIALAAILLILMYAVGLILLTGFAMGFDAYRDLTQWRERTSPLDPAVVNDICQKFGLPESDDRCKPGAVVYAPDFFNTIGGTFQPENGEWATYDQVEEKLGEYKYEEEPITKVSDGTEYFVAWYDLRGDRVYPIVIFFYSDGSLMRIIATVTD